jgi:hypothetical protein
MKIIRIFETKDQGLYSIKYDGESSDEFDRLFDLWQNVEYLENFFNLNIKDLASPFYGSISVENAVLLTLEDSRAFQRQLLEIAKYDLNKSRSLNYYFKPLDNISYKPGDLEKYKAYGTLRDSWIRIYAIKVSDNYFVITGGALKLTKKMSDRIHTKKELEKLDRCRDYLRSMGIFDEEGLK